MTINNEHKKLNVPNLRFPEFQGEWEEYKLEDITAEIGDGIHATPIYDDNGTFYFVNGNNISEYGITITATTQKVTAEEALRNNASALNSYSILLSINGTIGNVALYKNEPIMLGKSACYINVSSNINRNYIFYYLMMPKCQFYFTSELTGTTIKNLSLKSVRKTKVLLPNANEQSKIARLFDAINERIATQNKIIDKLQSLIKGIRNDVYGKLRKSVGVNAMISDVLSYEQPQPYIVKDTEYTAEGIPVLTANKAFVLGYTSETDGIYDKGDCIIFDDFTLDCKYVDFPFKVKSSAIKILTAKNKELLRYTFEFLKYLDLSTEEHKRHYIAETQNQEFILPTEQIVKTIAHIFSTLSVRMETAVKQRNVFEKQKQYLLRQMFI
ncbi:restriction endonuclease subunit S [Prevotella sp.]|uniref:restriction endonuclease subunit S n=1 Tax=Prevotella sp. TaxID=59823 RepID=UPI002E7A146C|nr:restriction endonuclease subunit S [Prevotella sp.]MEE0668986.1 restriction endonuclease subunit S [Prevotella sp.]